MDERVSKNFPRPEDISHYGPLTEFINVGRGIVLVLGNDSTCYKFSIDQRRKGAKASLLYKQSA